jgi:predicted hydrolase (HD superfamily)
VSEIEKIINGNCMSLLLNRKVFGNPTNAGNLLTKEAAMVLFSSWVLNPKLQIHMLQVAHLMKTWAAEKEGLNETEQWKWELSGLLHDADWDQWPDKHCIKIIEHLESLNIDPEVMHAIASHGPNHFGVDPENQIDKMLFAFDELSGLIHAYSILRPGGYEGMDVKGVKKRLKEKSFAANVSREEIQDAANRAGLELDTLIAFIVSKQSAHQ